MADPDRPNAIPEPMGQPEPSTSLTLAGTRRAVANKKRRSTLDIIDLPAEVPDEDCGPAMRALNQRQRKFVLAYLAFGSKATTLYGLATRAARAAGYKASSRQSMSKQGFILMHNPKVLSALREEAMVKSALIGPLLMEQLALMAISEKDPRLRFQAMLATLDRTGYHVVTEHHVKTEDVSKTEEALIARLRQLIARNPENLKLVPITLRERLGLPMPEVIDAKAKEVSPAES